MSGNGDELTNHSSELKSSSTRLEKKETKRGQGENVEERVEMSQVAENGSEVGRSMVRDLNGAPQPDGERPQLLTGAGQGGRNGDEDKVVNETETKKPTPTKRKRGPKSSKLPTRTRPRRGKESQSLVPKDQALQSLADLIKQEKTVVFLTGAGLSVASGIPPFRGRDDAVWAKSIHTWGTREKFEEGPLEWYNVFWLQHFDEGKAGQYKPNVGHNAIAALCKAHKGVHVMTQNVDRLHRHSTGGVTDDKLIEIHGFSGGFKCYTDDCKYSEKEVHFTTLRDKLQRKSDGSAFLASEDDLPKCPECGEIMIPNCLLFDEDYSDHESYQFEKAKRWLKDAEVLVFVGTSFAVQITNMAFCAAAERMPAASVFNFNVIDNVPEDRAARVHFQPILGPCEETLVELTKLVGIEVEAPDDVSPKEN
mmetsp:Transcript_3895/g.6858  ORF Transcript_3895/g.6858 Transcript_3895/m.6858 type:complete len:422 (-) Transcript_3895:127-1392(-)